MPWIDNGNQYLSWNDALINGQMVFSYLTTTAGLNEYQASAILGNMWIESTVNPWICEGLDCNNTLGGVGLNQWTPHQVLYNRLAALGLPQNNTTSSAGDDQLQVLNNEFQNVNNGGSIFGQWLDTGSFTWSAFNSSQDLDFLTECFMEAYLRPYAPSANLQGRQDAAFDFYQELADGQTPGAGTQLAVLPCRNTAPGLTLTQGEDGGFSHQGSLAMDFAYSQTNVDIFAPCDVECVAVDVPNATVVWKSQKPVRCADGTISDIVVMLVHDDQTASFSVGDKRAKNTKIGATGTAGNVTGDHIHIEVSKVKWEDDPTIYYLNPQGVYELRQSTHNYDVFSICDNVTDTPINIINNTGVNYPWVSNCDWIDGGDVPPSKSGGKELIILDKAGILNILNSNRRRRINR